MTYWLLIAFIPLVHCDSNATDIFPVYNETETAVYSSNITEDILNAQVIYASGKGISSAAVHEVNQTHVFTNSTLEVLTPLQYNLRHAQHVNKKDKLNEAAKQKPSLKKSIIEKSPLWKNAKGIQPKHITMPTGH